MATVLKQERLLNSPDAAQPVAFNVQDVQVRAKQYLEEVQQQAQQLLESARGEVDSIRQRAEEEGLLAAQQKFEKQVQDAAQRLSDERCRTAIATCEETVRTLSSATSEWLSIWRNQTVELAGKMAEKLVRRELRDENELLRVWLEEALVTMRDSRELRVLVHPDDFAVAGRFLQKLAKTVPQANTVEVLPDPEVQPGGCIVRSHHGQIDQQLETQLQRLVQQLSE